MSREDDSLPQSIQCQYPSCAQNATIHIAHVRDRRHNKLFHFCESHGNVHLHEERDWYNCVSRVGAGTPVSLKHGIGVDIDMVYWNDLRDSWCRQYVLLVESGGHRRIGNHIGVDSGTPLSYELNRTQPQRPLMHRVMTEAIKALGGHLQRVVIDNVFPEQKIYEAKLHICQGDTNILVDVRPGDALVLAVIVGVPIIVSQHVLELASQPMHVSTVSGPARGGCRQMERPHMDEHTSNSRRQKTNCVFVVEHLRTHDSGYEDVKMIGVYSSEAAARAAIQRLVKQPGFCDYPRIVNALKDDDPAGFYINEYEIDQDNWAEGFGVEWPPE